MRGFSLTRRWFLLTAVAFISFACGSDRLGFRGEEKKKDAASLEATGLAIDGNEHASVTTEADPAAGVENDVETGSDPVESVVPSENILCKLPYGEPALRLHGWTPPTGHGGTEVQEIIKACGFESKYVTCAMGVDPTTNSLAVLGCEAYGGPNPLNHGACISEAATKTSSNQNPSISQFQCIRSNTFAAILQEKVADQEAR